MEMPREIHVPQIQPMEGSTVSLLGWSGSLDWEKTGKGTTIRIPEQARKNPPCRQAWAFKLVVK